MSGYADSEKIQYALKTALYRTMQTSMSDSASVERSAPLRVFPTNIMKVNIIEAGKGDIGEDGTYVTGHATAGQTADLSDPESTVKNYKIICPVNNVITSITISALVGYGSQTKAQVDALPTSGQTYPLKQWFFRGHYSGSGEAAFNAANVTYDGLQLAWNSTTNNTTPSDADTVPHLKYYLQVQTNYTGVSHSSSTDNITYEHGLLKGLIGLDSNFVSTIMVTQGEGGPSSSASLGTSGSQSGDYWFTQPTAGILSFYGVTNKVDASTDLATANFATKYPMVSYVRYTGETGFGAGTGGGGGAAADPEQAVTSEPSWSSSSITTSFVDGNVGIGTTSPYSKLSFGNSIPDSDFTNGKGLIACYEGGTGNYFYGMGVGSSGSSLSTTAGLAFWGGSEGSNPSNSNCHLIINRSGNVGIGTTSPNSLLDIHKPLVETGINEADGIRFSTSYPDGNGQTWNWSLGYIGGYNLANNGTASGFPGGLVFKTKEGNSQEDHNLTTRMVIDANGNVGIGTTSPSQKLEVNGNILINNGTSVGGTGGKLIFDSGYDTSGPNKINYLSNGDNRFGIGIFAGEVRYHSSTMHSFYYDNGDNGTEVDTCAMMIKNGNVGIGTTNPGAPLEIYKKGHSYDEKGGAIILSRYAHGVDGVNNTSTPYRGSCIWHEYTGSPTYKDSMCFASSSGANPYTLSPSMVITEPGNVGIGTTSPDANLHIKGNSIPNLRLTYHDSQYNNGTVYMHFDHYSMNVYSNPLTLNNSSTTNIEMGLGGGNVGIGTSSPGSKLTVNGNVGCGAWSSDGNTSMFCVNSETAWGMKFVHSSNQYYTRFSIYGTGDDNRGFEFYDQGAATNKTRLFISGSGNVGIGTTSPGAPLEINGDSELLRIKGTSRTYITFYKGTTYQGFFGQANSANDNIYMAALNGSIVLQESGGNVGIGTTSPNAKLQVTGTSTNPSTSTQSSTSSQGILRLHGTGGLFMDFGFMLSSPYTGWIQTHNGTTNGTGDDLALQPVSGNVGIGTTDPSAPLHVKDNVDYGEPVARFEAGGDSFILVDNNWADNWGEVGVVIRGHSNAGYWLAGVDDSSTYQIKYDSSDFHFGGENLSLSITTDGKVGIGTTSPSSVILSNNRPALDIVGNGAYGTGRILFSDADSADNARNWCVGPYRSDDAQFQITPTTAKGGGTPDLTKVFCIEWTGNVGIGTKSPNAPLELIGYQYITYNDSSYTRYGPNSSWSHYLFVGSGPRFASANACVFNTNGNLHLDCANGYLLYLNHYSQCNVRTPNGLVYSSDDRLKHNEEIIDNALEIIKKIKVKKYFKSGKLYDEDYNYELDSSGNPITDDNYQIETGFIAQDVMKVPELEYLVYETEDAYDMKEVFKKDSSGNYIFDAYGNKITEKVKNLAVKARFGLRYNDIFVMNVQATQELDRKQQVDEAKITELENKVATLESELAAIKQHLGI